MRKLFFTWFIIFCLILISGVFALTPKEEKGVKTLKGPSLVYEQPDRTTPFSLDQAPDSITYRKSILPYEQDKDADMYVVLPTLGIITPIISLDKNSLDYKDMFAGKQIDINKYLVRGVLLHAGTGIPGEEGNPVIFGHSNFYKSKEGDYKTIFADIMNLDVGVDDEIRVFVKQENGAYDLRKFSIEKSYETVPTDVGVITPQGGKEITLYACTNGLAGRWILKGEYIEENETLVPYPMKRKMLDLLEKLKALDTIKRDRIIEQVLHKITSIRKNIPRGHISYHEKFKKYLLNWMERKLAEVY